MVTSQWGKDKQCVYDVSFRIKYSIKSFQMHFDGGVDHTWSTFNNSPYECQKYEKSNIRIVGKCINDEFIGVVDNEG